MILGFNLRDTLRSKRDIQTIIQRNDRLEKIIDLVNEKFVDTVNSNLIYQDAINGILSHLDPHTSYIPADRLEDVNNKLEGGFFGIGVEFSIIRDTIQVTSVVEGGPADQSGVETGDQLIKVGDSIVAGTGITSERIIKMLKGKQHSEVFVTLKEPVSSRLKDISIKRDVVPLYSVEANLMLDNTTGFIKINRFSATTYDEFIKAMRALQKSGMQNLVLDLRENPGGYLDAATDIADEFLDDKKLIVYTQGQHSAKRDYRSEKNGLFEKGRIAILVDESSASASEILAGAIQDWDRGIVMGRRTFGKGLVQEQYNLDDGSALRLTIARYYTPSGRCIQRSFAKGKDAYAEEFAHRFETGELTGNDSVIVPEDTVKYYTSQRRIVYGGGGIKPDVYVPYDATKLTPGVLNMFYSDDVKNVIWDYFVTNKATLTQYKTIAAYASGFKADGLIKLYISRLDPQMRKMTLKVFAKTQNLKFFSLQMKAQLARILFHNNGYYAITLRDDNMVSKALQVVNSKDYLAIIKR